MRRNGDLAAQRRFAWVLFSRVVAPTGSDTRPAFESWYGEDAVFTVDSDKAALGFSGFARRAGVKASDSPSSGGAPVLTYTLYNGAAYRHIRDHRLHLSGELGRLRQAGLIDRSIPASRSIPDFPAESAILKTAWWPVARDRPTAMPVWDPEANPARGGGNSYMTWNRVVAVDPRPAGVRGDTVPVEFAGRSVRTAKRVALDDFYHVQVEASLARRLSLDTSASMAALVILGRPFEAGDSLVLVGANLATKDLQDWAWATLWWHDQADDDAVAAQERPATLRTPWRQYLLQAAFDSSKPAAADGGPHVCFNPWLEGRFFDGGMGGGTVSNCQSCHRRASYPAVAFLPVTRGEPDLIHDPAYQPGQLRTSFIWSIAMHAIPEKSQGSSP